MSSPPSSPILQIADSSPESSPILEPIDSSPPSSPSFQPISPPVSPGLAHPFAASTKAVKPPRLYEKRGAYASDDDDDASDEGLNDQDYASRTRQNTLWSLSPRKKKTSRYARARALSTASTSSSITEIPLDRPLAPRQLLFGNPRLPQRSISTDSRDDLAAIDLSDDETTGSPSNSRSRAQQDIWDSAITTAIDSADGLINLQQDGLISSGLSFIPPSIADLASLVVLPSKDRDAIPAIPLLTARVRPFTRATTFPARGKGLFTDDAEHSLAKATSMNLRGPPGSSVLPVMNEVNLLLGNNVITKLPLELFSLTNLTVLSMRNNLLTRIPPQITQLINLRELNVAQNRLTFLPAEMLEMSLEVLVIDRNPWLELSTLDSDSNGSRVPLTSTLSKRSLQRTAHSFSREAATANPPRLAVSKTVTHYIIPSLTECCLRVLLAPHTDAGQTVPTRPRPSTRLETMYELPLPHIDHYPPALVKTLRACVPRAVAKSDSHMQASPSKRARHSSARSRTSSTLSDVFGPAATIEEVDVEEEPEETHSGIGTCMSPAHPRHSRPVFVDPAEERFAWVRTVAGQAVHEDVPVLWRGCMPGCLSFLSDEAEDVATAKDTSSSRPSACDGDGWVLDVGGSDESDDVEVQAIDLAGGLTDEFD